MNTNYLYKKSKWNNIGPLDIMKKYRLFVAALVVALVSFMFVVTAFSIAPDNFPGRRIVSIPKSTYLGAAAKILHDKGVIRSELLFKVYAMIVSGHRQIQAGDYLFTEPQSALRIAYRTTHGVQDLPKISVTLYEGMTVKDMGVQIKKNIPQFDNTTFYNMAKSYEGYLFPDTYFFYENVTPGQVMETLRDNFNQKIKTALLDIQASGKSLQDVIAMASIVEREATSSADRKLIAGVLWKRISIGMPLQVDPPFYYILGKDSSEITLKDLAMNSPYNLYKNKGLPPTPITNPGMSSILATVNPTTSNNLFFLSDKKGAIHYAPTYEGHIANKLKYLQ
ncbi:MAG: endolytic transglycosylase MltG [Candidatus Taylorbacteria bacterium]